jgi:glutamine cyclotransferase
MLTRQAFSNMPKNGLALLLVVCLSVSLLAACAPTPIATPVAEWPTATPIPAPTPTSAARNFTYQVVNAYPHDRDAFTQGLVFEDGVLYEGTGRHGYSTLRRVDLASGDVLQIRQLPDRFFGEGITIFGERIVQLTWQSGVGFVYDKNSFELLEEFSYPTEGWGITHDGERLIMSDGTSTLRFWNPETFEEIGRIEVRDRDGPVTRLNELEYVRGEIYANVWQTDRIARIAPDTGEVIGWIELAGLLSLEDRSEPVDVLNGIAYDAENDRLFVTGKLWPRLFEIELVPLE